MRTKIFLLLVFILAFLLLVTLQGCSHHKFLIGSSSMSPTLVPGEVIITVPFDFRRDSLRRYQIAVFHSPVDQSGIWVMRILGLPGEQVTINTNLVSINGIDLAQTELPAALRQKSWLNARILASGLPQHWSLATNEAFVVGDNLESANDSRYWGPLKVSSITDVVQKKRTRWRVRIWPP